MLTGDDLGEHGGKFIPEVVQPCAAGEGGGNNSCAKPFRPPAEDCLSHVRSGWKFEGGKKQNIKVPKY